MQANRHVPHVDVGVRDGILELDAAANAADAARISRDGVRVAAFVIPTDEEAVIAEDALAAVQRGG